MKISVIMCVMNSMPYVMASVQSFIDQKYKNKELIIVYSKSTDNTFQYLKSLNNKNIKIFKYNGKGVYSALNFGIKKHQVRLSAYYIQMICFMTKKQ